MAYAKERGKLITFDPNLRPPLWQSEEEARAQILWGLSQADVVKISDVEVDFLWYCYSEEGADRLLRDYGVSLAMVTMGPKGCYLKNARASYTAAALPGIIEALLQDGYTFVPISQIILPQPYTIDHMGRQLPTQ